MTSVSGFRVVASALLVLAVAAPAHSQTQDERADQSLSFAVYALSKGAGVPKEARLGLHWSEATLRKAKASGISLRMEKQVLGIEGEQRLCVTVANSAIGRELLARIRSHTRGVPLFRVELESCHHDEKLGD